MKIKVKVFESPKTHKKTTALVALYGKICKSLTYDIYTISKALDLPIAEVRKLPIGEYDCKIEKGEID